MAACCLSLAACGDDGPRQGRVLDRDYEPATVSIVWIAGTCTQIGAVTNCTPPQAIPVSSNEVWKLYLQDGDGRKGWRDVSRETYERCADGDWCQT